MRTTDTQNSEKPHKIYITDKLILDLNLGKIISDGVIKKLSPQQFCVLKLLTENANNVVCGD